MQFLFFTIFLILFNYSILAAESLIVKASSQYGTNQSQDQGCLQAKNEVMKEARRKIGAGETLSGDSLKICKASNDYAKCEMFTNSFHSLGKVAILGFDQIGDIRLRDHDGLPSLCFTRPYYNILGNILLEGQPRISEAPVKFPI